MLFWNVRGNAIGELVAECVEEHGADIFFLAEHDGIEPESLCEMLRLRYFWVNTNSGCDKVRMFIRNSIDVIDLFEMDRYLICTVSVGGVVYNLASLHLQDRRNSDADARLHVARGVVSNLGEQERKYGCHDSVIIGDFNASPFDKELLTMDAFNATLFKDVIRSKAVRVRLGEEFALMFNPTLHFISEDTKNYGSYYYDGGGEFSPLYWYSLDQAIVSPSLMDSVDDYIYLRNIGDTRLVPSVRPLPNISDHLPLLVTLGENDGCVKQTFGPRHWNTKSTPAQKMSKG